MAIYLHELGNVISVAEFRLGRNINNIRPIEFRYLSNMKNETLYTHNRTIIEALLYGTFLDAQYRTEIRAISKETEKENYFEMNQENICGTIDKYLNLIDTIGKNRRSEEIKLDKVVTTTTYKDATTKTENDYNFTFNMKNGVDFEIGEISKDYIVTSNQRAANITSEDGSFIDSVYIFGDDSVFMLDCNKNTNHAEIYDFSKSKENPKYYEFNNFANVFVPFSGIPMMTILPTLVNINDERDISIEYDKFGLVVSTDDVYETGYFTGKEETISLHPLYLDIFDTSNVYNKNKYVIDYVNNRDDSKHVYYTRLIVEVNDIDALNQRIKDGEDIKPPKFDTFYIPRDSSAEILSNEEYVKRETERINKLFGI